MGAEGHWAFVLAAYAAALGLPVALGAWTWARGRRAARAFDLLERSGVRPGRR